jgi:hypothetical protein
VQCSESIAASPKAAYFVGVCRLGRDDLRAAEIAFDNAASSPGWQTLALYMRGIVRAKLGAELDGQADMTAALAEVDLPPELLEPGKTFLKNIQGPRLHGAAGIGLGYDSNALQAPLVQLPGVSTRPSAVISATALLSWEAAPRLNLRLALLTRQVPQASEASITGALLEGGWKSSGGTFRALFDAHVGGFLLRTAPFLATFEGDAGAEWAPSDDVRVTLRGRGLLKEFAVPYLGLAGPVAGVTLDGERWWGQLVLRGALDHFTEWTSDPDFARNVETATIEVKNSWGPWSARLALAGSLQPYLHVNSLVNGDNVRALRQDQQLQATLGAEWNCAPGWNLNVEVVGAMNLSSIAAYDYRRLLATAGATYAF